MLERLVKFLYIVLSPALVLASILLIHPAMLERWNMSTIGGSEGDGGLYVWLTQSFHFHPLQALTFESNTLYPYPLTRAWSDSFLLPSIAVHILAEFGTPLHIAYNFVIMSALVLNGVATQALARAVAAPRLAALAAAILFANCSYIFGNLGHPQLMFFFWAPLSWSLIIGRPPRFVPWLLAGLCTSASFYCSVYFSIFGVLGAALIMVLRLAGRSMPVIHAITAGLAFAVGLLPILPAVPSYLAIEGAFGSRQLFEAAAFSASGISFVSFSSFNDLFGATASWTNAEATLCAGYLVTVVALWFALYSSRERSMAWTYLNGALVAVTLVASSIRGYGELPHLICAAALWGLLLAAPTLCIRERTLGSLLYCVVVVFFVLSMGPGGAEVNNEPMHAPLAYVWGHVPGFDSIRAVARYGIVVVMGLCIASCWAVSSLDRGSKALSFILLLVFLVGGLFENRISTFPLDPPLPPPKAFAALATRAGEDVAALALPFTGRNEKGEISWSRIATLNSKYAIWGAPFTFKLVNGYSGQRSRLQYALAEKLLSFPSADSLYEVSRVCGVEWIIIVPSLEKEWNEAKFKEDLKAFSAYLSIVETYPDGSILLKLIPTTTVSGGKPVTLLAPEGRDLSIKARAKGSSCTLKAYQLSRGEGRNDKPSHRIALTVDQETSVKLQNATPTGAGAPTAFQLEVEGACEASLACSLR